MPSEVLDCIKSLKKKKAPGHDKISNNMIQRFPKKTIFTFVKIINLIVKWQYFPQDRKLTLITPISKPGKPPNKPDSCRPISLLPCFSKITEVVIIKRINQHLEVNIILIPFQLGFRKHLRTTNQLYRVVENITEDNVLADNSLEVYGKLSVEESVKAICEKCNETISSPADCEIRAVIKFLNARNVKPAEIYRQVTEVYGEYAISDGMVRKWVRMFNASRTNVHAEARSGRPSVVTDDLVRKVDEAIHENRRFTMTTLSEAFPQISRAVLFEIVSDRLNYRKLCSRWVPKMLTDVHKTKRLGSALTFLTRYSDEGENFLNQIVTGDETWVCHFTPESKQQSMEWRHTHSPKKQKFKVTMSSQKIMCTVFWDRKGVLLTEFLPRGETINAARYCETLTKLRRAIQNKRRGMLSKGIVLLHDNARPHTAGVTQSLIRQFHWEQFDHPPYSPDLAPSDYHLFLHMKRELGGKCFGSDDDTKNAVESWLSKLAGSFFDDGIQKLVTRYDKCLIIGRNYV
ncbi:Histone-lysine N-methyltransferase SETMAR, partial [Stegodyphus mimosarum]